MQNNETAALMRFLRHTVRTSSDAPRSELKVVVAMMQVTRRSARAERAWQFLSEIRYVVNTDYVMRLTTPQRPHSGEGEEQRLDIR
jgi:hypothetical protein